VQTVALIFRITTCLSKINQLALTKSFNVSFYEVKKCVTFRREVNAHTRNCRIAYAAGRQGSLKTRINTGAQYFFPPYLCGVIEMHPTKEYFCFLYNK